jgi:membrane protein DedA with SNARE-associated domain
MQAQLTHQLTLSASDLTPTGYFAVIGLLAACLGYMVLFLSTIISVVGSRLTPGMKLVWVIFAFVAPFLGSLCWFIIGRLDAERRPDLARY